MNNKQNLSQTTPHRQPKQFGDYIIGKTLGEGTFGKVRLATHKLTKQKVAIKFLEKKKLSDVADIERVSRQIHILKLIRHPSLVQLYQIIQTPKQLLLVMQFMENGELFDYIVKNKRINEEEACRMFNELIDGIQYFHKLGIVHRDLKPQNILLDYNKSIKIVDFGLSNLYKNDEKLKTPCGSPCYAAPQMIKNQAYSGLSVDIWSSGIILFAMTCGYLPFEDEVVTNLYQKIFKGEYTFHKSVSSQAKDLIKCILNLDPLKRYTLQQIRNHPWMKKHQITNRKIHQGIIIGYNKIPVDKNVLNMLSQFTDYDLDYVQKCLEANRYNEKTATYYLALKQHIRNGGTSNCDIGSNQFDKTFIQPARRKKQSQILIDNFLTKNSYSSGDNAGKIVNRTMKNNNRKSVERTIKESNKQNISIFINKKKSKDKSIDVKNRSKDKIAFKQQNISIVGNLRNKKVDERAQRKSESGIKPRRSSSGNKNGNVQGLKKQKHKLNTSINFKVPASTKSIQKSSGRDSSKTKDNQRVSFIQNRISRKYKQKFNQSIISKSGGKLKSSTQRQKIRINSSINQSVQQGPVNYQGFNTTTLANVSTYAANTIITKKCKQIDNSDYIDEYLKGKRTTDTKRNRIMSNIAKQTSTKILKAKRM